MPQGNDTASPHNLRSQAADSITNAITRGRKRRAGRRDVTSTAIQIGQTTNIQPEKLANPAKQLHTIPYHKRRRTSLIPEEDGDNDDDSNDEWEEHVDMDVEKVEAAVESLKKQSTTTDKHTTAKGGNDGITSDEKQSEERTDEQADQAVCESEHKARERRRAAAKRKKLLRRHSVHILLSVAHLLRLDIAANDDDVRSFALSLAPDDTFLRQGVFDERLSRLALWITATFQPTAMVQVSAVKGRKKSLARRLCSASERAISCAGALSGDIMDLSALTAALIRVQGFRCRIVSALQPVSYQKSKSTGNPSGKARVVEANPDQDAVPVLYSWLEVWSPDVKRWIPLDLCAGVASSEDHAGIIRTSMSRMRTTEVDEVSVIEKKPIEQDSSPCTRRRSSRRLQKRAKEEPEQPPRKLRSVLFSHVVAAENGFTTDVTRRYVSGWTEVDKTRAKGRPYEKVIELFSDRSPEKAKDEAYSAEVEEFDALAAAEAIPTSVSALQYHPRFILERHVKKYETIFPRTPIVGYLKDEPVFLRSNVHLLHTKDRWIRRMRKVLDDAKPIKSVRSKNGTDDTVDLYGEWQTTALIIPECVNGKVPTSVHGNVDLWTPEHLPKGTVHIDLPYARVAARKLGVDFAPAMTGFELRKGRSVPKIEGIVIAADNADMIRDAARAAARAAHERQVKKMKKEEKEREEKAKREARAREEVEKRYGGKGEPEMEKTAQKRSVLRRELQKKFCDEGGPEENENITTNSENTGPSDAHEHEFDEARCLEGDTWVKTCKICGLDVSFERL